MSSSIRGNSTKREGSARIRAKNGMPSYECTYSYIVECTAVDEPYSSVLATTGLPLVGQTADPTGLGVCISKSGTRRPDNPKVWDVVCEFSSEIEDDNGSSGDPSSDPTTWVPIYETKYERIQEQLNFDASGTLITNSKGILFPDGITLTRFIPIWEFYQFEASTVTDQNILSRNEAVNSATFAGCAAKTLLCCVLSSTIGRYYGTLRRLTKYQLKYNSKTWVQKRIDQMPDGTLLDGAGGVLGAGLPPETIDFDIYPSISFSFIRT